jgi:phage-related minor tail protein
LIKCHHCGYSFQIICIWNYAKTERKKYLYDIGYRKANGCIQYRSKYKPNDVEEVVFATMKEKLESMEIAKSQKANPNAELEMMKREIIRLEEEINKWIDKLADDSDEDAFTKRVKAKVNALDDKKAELERKLHALIRKNRVVDTEPLLDPISRWDALSVEDKNKVAKNHDRGNLPLQRIGN